MFYVDLTSGNGYSSEPGWERPLEISEADALDYFHRECAPESHLPAMMQGRTLRLLQDMGEHRPVRVVGEYTFPWV